MPAWIWPLLRYRRCKTTKSGYLLAAGWRRTEEPYHHPSRVDVSLLRLRRRHHVGEAQTLTLHPRFRQERISGGWRTITLRIGLVLTPEFLLDLGEIDRVRS